MGSNLFASSRKAFLSIFLLLAPPFMARATEYTPVEGWQTYFGDALPHLTATEMAAFERGFKIFVSPFPGNVDNARNASSCVECHNVPMPGGSAGVAPVGIVNVDPAEPVGDVSQIVQRNHALSTHTGTLEPRRTPALFGIGLVEHADIPNSGRLGVSANRASLSEFVSSAIAVELGASTPQHCARRIDQLAYPTRCTVDVGQDIVDDLVAYLRFLAPPKPNSGAVGKSQFLAVGCSDCHSSSLKTRSNAPTPLRNRTFQPYSDFALHDLGAGQRIRTAPLWGLTSYGPPYMHDAGSMSIQDAITRHQGEASEALERYRSLSPIERAELVKFLQQL